MAHKVDKITGVVLRRLRDRAGVSQETLGARVGVSYQQVQKYETGQNRVSVSRLFDIARALETEAHVIVRLVEFEVKAEGEFSG